jgi:hypothetical protein
MAQIISSGRTFLWRLFDAYPSSRHGCVMISPSVLADLSWWSRFLLVWNGSFKIQSDSDCCCFAFTSDTSNTACGGGIHGPSSGPHIVPPTAFMAH